MTQSNKTTMYCLIAAGGVQPGIKKLSLGDSSLAVETLLAFQAGQSIYGISLSPSLHRIAAVTKFGDIGVFCNDNSMRKEKSLLYRTSTTPMVFGLSFLRDDILLASGSDFQIRIYDISGKKDNERTGVLHLPGIAFALTSVTEHTFCAIVREERTDHLMVWDIRTKERIFRGPAFKIASNYFNAAIEIDSVSGIIAHGDRMGLLHIYDIKNNYSYSNLQTNHGNFYGICFNDGYLYTAGEADRGVINRWKFGEKRILESYRGLNLPVYALNRLDKDHIAASLSNGQVVLFEHKQSLKEKERKIVQDMRQIISLPSHYVISLDDVRRSEFAREQLHIIQSYYNQGDIDKAYKAIIELETSGFKAEALLALAMLENAQGKSLSELESLLSLLNNKPIIDEIIPSLKRLAELLEDIHEPELAIFTLLQLNEIEAEPGIQQKIEQLKSRCVPAFNGILLLAGFPEKELVKPEIRKAMILNRYFEEAVSFTHEKITQPLNAQVSLDTVAENLLKKNNPLFDRIVKSEIICKRGQNVSDILEMIRIIPDSHALKFIEFWIECRTTYDEKKLALYHVFYPNSDDKPDSWNDMVMELYSKTCENPGVQEWYEKIEKYVRSAIVISRDTPEEEDMFSIRRTVS